MALLGTVPFTLYRPLRHAGGGFLSGSISGSLVFGQPDGISGSTDLGFRDYSMRAEEVLVLSPLMATNTIRLMSASLVPGQERRIKNNGTFGSITVHDPVAATTLDTVPILSSSVFMSNGTIWAKIS
jgi:hypothetical protein